jgi:hypothetical protein
MAIDLGDGVKDLFNIVKHKRFIIPAGVMILVAVMAVFVGPKVTGFAGFSNGLDECKADLETCGANIDSLTTKNTQLESDLAAARNTISEKENEIKLLIDQNALDKENWETDYEGLANMFNTVVDKNGNNICCMQQILNSDYNSYNVEDGEIKCDIDGTFAINCEDL